MTIVTLILTAFALSLDAFAVALCKGLAVKKAGIKQMLLAGAWFGGFQALMPVLGYFFGATLAGYVENYTHWIAFILLAVIGANMIKEALSKEEKEDCSSASMRMKEMFTLAVATSIDALIVGIGISLEPICDLFENPEMNMIVTVGLIGIITFILSAAGIKIGNIFGLKFKKKAEIAGGVILILMGLKILLEGLGIIG